MAELGADTNFYLCSELLRDTETLLGTMEFYLHVMPAKDLEVLTGATIALIDIAAEHYIALMEDKSCDPNQRASWDAFLTRKMKDVRNRAEAMEVKTS